MAAGPYILEVSDPGRLAASLEEHGVGTGRTVIVFIGGAGGMSGDVESDINALLVERLIPAFDRWGAAVVDGGTDSGVMRALGRARERCGAEFPLIGVAASGTVADGKVALEEHHTHAVLVPGDNWGDETPWISATAGVIAEDHRSVTVLVNGGDISYEDAAVSIRAERPLVVLAGTGRAADEIAAARTTGEGDTRALAIAGSAQTRIIDVGRFDDVLDVITEITR